MSDPFQDVDAAGPEFIKLFADSMDVRQADPTMEKIVANYLSQVDFHKGSLTVEIGTGAGAVARRIAAHAAPESVIGFDPSEGFVKEAISRIGNDHPNLRFETADGTDLPLDDGSVDVVIMHTVLTHVINPAALLSEAFRVLKSGGRLIVCDADFSKATFSNSASDPLNACATAFAANFVTDAFLVGKMRSLIIEAGFGLQSFDVESRVVTGAEPMRAWVDTTTKLMIERDEIGEELAAGLMSELDRRAEKGTLYGYQAFATALGVKG